MASRCVNCKSSAWCLGKVWPEEKEFFDSDKVELETQVVKCDNCGLFWRVLISPGVGGMVNTNFQPWEVRPCEQEEEEFGYVEQCTSCRGHPEKVELPMRNGGQLNITIRDGST